ncbi:LuxR family transcriptional regulator [Nocardioides sp.]|uniref:helix-turn-helix transcriptional regulator n=1 Tax=Nocardioides sp. TaxID=35761 RepID=UPI002733BF82|nr:LuxR family transcriptional regulator [Nocardioides sp.]MDP3891782.1 LuxR C-terminal-related transcriptional regulator [Nocardioides sp.]
MAATITYPAPLVGRDREYARLGAALDGCRRGGGGLVLVSGESGIGKSRLVSEALADWPGRARRTTVAPGAGPFAPLRNLLAGERSAEHDDGYAEAAEVAASLRAAAGGQPLVLVVEDLQLSDSATLDLLPDLATALTRERVLMLGTYRSDELPRTHPIRGVRAALRRQGLLIDIHVTPLDRDGTAALLAALLGDQPESGLLDAVHSRTEGVPFFIEELAAALAEAHALALSADEVRLAEQASLPLPEGVRDAVLARTAGLRKQHRDAVEVAATLGTQVDLDALADLVGGSATDDLLEQGLLLEFDTGVSAFRHTLVRDVLYRSIPWGRRRQHHRRVAEASAARPLSPSVVAEHWIAAGEPALARPLLLAAAERACAAHAYRDAAALARRALSLWPETDDPAGRLATLVRMAECAEFSAAHTTAIEIWTDLAVRHSGGGRMADAAQAHRRAANAAGLSGDLTVAGAHRLAAAEAYSEAGDHEAAAIEHITLAEHLKALGQLTEGLAQAVRAGAEAKRAGVDDLRGRAMTLQGAVRAALGDSASGVDLARSGLAIALSGRLSEHTGAAHYELGEALEYAADYAGAVAAYESTFELCRTHGFADLAEACFVCMSPVVRLMGEWDRSLAICAEVHAQESAQMLTHRVADEEAGLIYALRGDRRRARGPLRRGAEFGQANGIFGIEVGSTWGLALVASLDGDQSITRRLVTDMVTRCAGNEECHYALPALRWAASYLTEVGDAQGVAGCHRVAAMKAVHNGSPKVLSALAHIGAELAVVGGDQATGEVQFARSLDLLGGITAPYERAHTQLRRGMSAAARSEGDLAVELITSAYRTARTLRARPLAQQCAAALSTMGEQVDQRIGRLGARALVRSGLTRREQQVLQLLAEGGTNRQIAGELFLSVRTVDMHVRNVLAKLDCTTRTAAVRVATERGLVPKSV